MVKLVLITLQVTVTFTCGMEIEYLNNHFITIIQDCHGCEHVAGNATTLWQPYCNLQLCGKVAKTTLYHKVCYYQIALLQSGVDLDFWEVLCNYIMGATLRNTHSVQGTWVYL